MIFEGLGQQFKELIAPKPKLIATKPEAETAETKVYQPISPWEVLKGEHPGDEQLAEYIHLSFKPIHLMGGEYKFVPLPDQNGENLYVCESVVGSDGVVKAAFWLDPEKWQATLDEFSELARKFGDASLRLQISSHMPSADLGAENEAISITPLSRESPSTYRQGSYTYNLLSNGAISIESEAFGFHDLGYLNPKRRLAEVADLLKKELRGQIIHREEMPYRQSTLAIVTDGKGRFLVVNKAVYQKDQWAFPGGGIDEWETPEQSVKRELVEELKTSKFEIIGRSRNIYHYEWSDQVIASSLQKNQPHFRGTELTQFLVKFTGDPDEVKPGDGINAVRWVTKEELKTHLIFPGQWENAEKVIQEFSSEST